MCTRDDLAEILFQSFLREVIVNGPGICRNVHSLDIVHSAFPPSTIMLPTLQGTPEDSFGEAVVARDDSQAMRVSVS